MIYKDGQTDLADWNLDPHDYSDVSQAIVLTNTAFDQMAYNKSTGWMYYDGSVWRQDEETVRRLAQEIAIQQEKTAAARLDDANKALSEAECKDITDGDDTTGGNVKDAQKVVKDAKAYLRYTVKAKQTSRIGAAVTESAPRRQIRIEDLDHDPFLLNCPGGSYDLLHGEMRSHRYEDYCTHMTAVDPGDQGKAEWIEFIDQITCGDNDLAVYLQELFGRAAIGRVYQEDLNIFFGGGGNGKSTLTNVIKEVMGDYAVQSTPRLLIAEDKVGKEAQMGVFRGRRLVLMSELEAGMMLDAATMKRLVSTDDIYVNPKYKEPYSYTPTHTTILSTNYRPRVSNQDKGTWDRLAIVPFNAEFRGGDDERKNYAQYLARECGPYILRWIIDGAGYYIENDFKMIQPEAVKQATQEYHDENDWIVIFINSCCDTGPNLVCSSSDLYKTYKDYAIAMGDYPVQQKVFNTAMESHGYAKRRDNAGVWFRGLRVIHSVADLRHDGSSSGQPADGSMEDLLTSDPPPIRGDR